MSAPDQPVPSTGLKAKARRVAAPVVAKARQEIVRAAADDQQALRAEVAALRMELTRQAASHAAEIAALREEVAGLVAARRR